MMKVCTYTYLIVLLVSMPMMTNAQINLSVEGKVNISTMDSDLTSDSIVVLQANNDLAIQSKERLANRDSDGCNLGYYVIPFDFDFQNISSTHENAVWEIRHCHDLAGATVTMPIGVSLYFRGGKLSNYQSIIGQRTQLDAGSYHIFDGQLLDGSWVVSSVDPTWFGANTDSTIDSHAGFEKALEFCIGNALRKMSIPPGNYHLSNPWTIRHSNGNQNYYPIAIDGYGAVFDQDACISCDGRSRFGAV